MKKLLVLCPSRARPYRLLDMIRNFEETTNPFHSTLMVLLDKDDSCLGQYLEKIPSWVKISVFDRTGDNTYTTEIINKAFEDNRDYEFYSVTNDDMFYTTNGWDETLCEKGHLTCGKEINSFKKHGWIRRHSMTHKGGFPYTSVIDGDLVREVGWLQYPKCICSIGDGIWYYLTRKLEVFYPNINVEYEHRSHYWGRGEYDETAQRTDARKHMDTDNYELRQFKNHHMMKIVKRIKEKESCQI